MQVTDDFANALHPTAFDDCYLTPEEIASSPAAQAFADGFRAATANAMGVDPSTIILNGISTDGDEEPGCSGGSGEGDSAVNHEVGLTISDEFASQIFSQDTMSDCYISPEEAASSAE